jgi:transcriptional antiterminator RfaH
MANRWYVAQTQPGGQSLALLHLLRQGFQAYVPMMRQRRGAETIAVPLFPGYVFINLNLDVEPWSRVNGTRGVVHLLPSHVESPSPLPSGFIEELRALVEGGTWDDLSLEQLLASYAPGAEVRIASGALTDQTGVIISRKRDRVDVLVSLLGRETMVRVKPAQLELVAV